ncbi:MAG: hypothetical protein EZS28_018490 [Streblomastix strix]|uniref:Uncharacterized protein n=1 Tax=Streblomastix strix TaxID=222440 RepID=A0A5J4VUG4_9EUKA|nr:MAG: hypothetical protein EZS28_018490 [Streblomastix strix]
MSLSDTYISGSRQSVEMESNVNVLKNQLIELKRQHAIKRDELETTIDVQQSLLAARDELSRKLHEEETKAERARSDTQRLLKMESDMQALLTALREEMGRANKRKEENEKQKELEKEKLKLKKEKKEAKQNKQPRSLNNNIDDSDDEQTYSDDDWSNIDSLKKKKQEREQEIEKEKELYGLSNNQSSIVQSRDDIEKQRLYQYLLQIRSEVYENEDETVKCTSRWNQLSAEIKETKVKLSREKDQLNSEKIKQLEKQKEAQFKSDKEKDKMNRIEEHLRQKEKEWEV